MVVFACVTLHGVLFSIHPQKSVFFKNLCLFNRFSLLGNFPINWKTIWVSILYLPRAAGVEGLRGREEMKSERQQGARSRVPCSVSVSSLLLHLWHRGATGGRLEVLGIAAACGLHSSRVTASWMNEGGPGQKQGGQVSTLCVNLVAPWCPDIWSNITLGLSVKIFFGWN